MKFNKYLFLTIPPITRMILDKTNTENATDKIFKENKWGNWMYCDFDFNCSDQEFFDYQIKWEQIFTTLNLSDLNNKECHKNIKTIFQVNNGPYQNIINNFLENLPPINIFCIFLVLPKIKKVCFFCNHYYCDGPSPIWQKKAKK